MYKLIIRPLLFCLDAEQAHRLAFKLLSIIFSFYPVRWFFKKIYTSKIPLKPVWVAGIQFPNRVGLAAGFDKNAELLHVWHLLGFGFVEIGTVTPLPQSGNPKPRLFRLINEKAIINRMGFNNDGVEIIAKRLANKPKDLIVGGNIGKNKSTPNERAFEDYLKCFTTLHDYVDYFVVNVSSPNTPNLRDLQEKEPLKLILQKLQEVNKIQKKPKPIFLKIAPDLPFEQIDTILETVVETNIAGLVVCNTTIRRDLLKNTSPIKLKQIGYGGLSGKPLKEVNDSILEYITLKSHGKMDIIAVGGIFTPKDALDKICLGAKLIQIYTSFIFEGPKIVYKLNTYL